MAKGIHAWGLCDQCGFRYRLSALKKTSYGTFACNVCYDGAFDIQNHPQNRIRSLGDDENLRDPSPEEPMTSTGPSVISIGWPYQLNLDTGAVSIVS